MYLPDERSGQVRRATSIEVLVACECRFPYAPLLIRAGSSRFPNHCSALGAVIPLCLRNLSNKQTFGRARGQCERWSVRGRRITAHLRQKICNRLRSHRNGPRHLGGTEPIDCSGVAWPSGTPGEHETPGELVTKFYDADFWRQRAEEARAVAEVMTLPLARREMEFIAAAYDRLADRAERTAGQKGTRERS